MNFSSTPYQQHQIEVINRIEHLVSQNAMDFSTVEPVEDYDNDERMSLTSVHFPHQDLLEYVTEQFIEPLKAIQPEQYYYRPESLHMTIKNIRVINHPPHFNDQDIAKARQVFNQVLPQHHPFQVYFYRLLLFPANLALVGTTDSELDAIHLHLDEELQKAGVPDDKNYANKQYFFSNMTLARFMEPVSDQFRQKVTELSEAISVKPYTVNSVSLVKANATMTICERLQTWYL